MSFLIMCCHEHFFDIEVVVASSHVLDLRENLKGKYKLGDLGIRGVSAN